MRKYAILIVIAMMLTACGTRNMDSAHSQEKITTDSKTEDVTETVSDVVMADNETDKEYYEDNFSVSSDVVEEYAKKIKQAVKEKDISKLADLVTYPVYIGLGDGQIIESRADFIKLDSAEIFTDELLESIENADESGLEPSMAGFVLWSSEGAPSIIFGIQEGQMGITGINY